MKLFQKILTATVFTLILFTLVFWLVRVLFIVSDEINSFQKSSWEENPWAVAQANIELERMRTSLSQYSHTPTEENKRVAIERIEIFWSRLDVLENGPNKEVFNKNTPLKELALFINTFLYTHEEGIYDLTPNVHKLLIDHSKSWSALWQSNSRDTYYQSTSLVTEIGNHTIVTYEKIRILLIFISLFIVVLIMGLIYLLIRNNRLLIKANDVSKMKTDFLANMSHELRTPLNGIIGSINLFKSDNEEQNELIEILDKSSEALLAQIDDILDYSQIESGEILLEKISFCLRDLIIDCTSIFKLKAEDKNLYLDISTSQDLDIYIKGDKTKIRQVILNLISNAIKFTEHGGITIDVSYIIHKNNYTIELKIIDTGIGISQKNQKTLFSSFSQADTSIKRRFGGSGLGLSISKKLMASMQGQLTLESKVDVGTKLGFVIDLEKSSLEEINSNQKDLKHYSSISRKKLNFSGKKILVVEDNVVNQKIINKILIGFNIEVFIAENGIQATEYSMADIDLIFMDIQMPLMDGVTASKIIREKGLTLPIVALTANATNEYKQKCEDAGMDEFLSKPFNLDKIECILVKYF